MDVGKMPKLLGSLARYLATGNEADGTAARFLWDQVVEHHSFATRSAVRSVP
jgi:hypothetical protein